MTLYRVGRREVEPILSWCVPGSGAGRRVSEVALGRTGTGDTSTPGLWVEKPHLCWTVVERIVKVEVNECLVGCKGFGDEV
jgi:hypothetical protein